MKKLLCVELFNTESLFNGDLLLLNAKKVHFKVENDAHFPWQNNKDELV